MVGRMRKPLGRIWMPARQVGSSVLVCFLLIVFCWTGYAEAQGRKKTAEKSGQKETAGELSWEMPGRFSIYDLQLGPAVMQNNEWKFLSDSRTLNAESFGQRLTMMVRFSYKGSRADIPVKFVVKLPGARQYEETVQLASSQGQYSYKFTVHNPKDFVGNGSVYLYFGFSIVDALDFTIMPGG
jgi:hypothetical protein